MFKVIYLPTGTTCNVFCRLNDAVTWCRYYPDSDLGIVRTADAKADALSYNAKGQLT